MTGSALPLLQSLEPQQLALLSSMHDELPYLNPPGKFDLLGKKARWHFAMNARALLAKGRELYPGKPYRMFTDVDDLIVLPSQYVDETRNEPALDFLEFFSDNFHSGIPGFDGFAFNDRPDELLIRTINKRLTKLLNHVTAPLSAEADFATKLLLGTSPEWKELDFKEAMLDLVARLSSRVFLGNELCRNAKWLEISKSYSMNSFLAADLLRQYPKWFRPIACRFIPQCQLLRTQVAAGHTVLAPLLGKRQRELQEAMAKGKPAPPYNDALQWFAEESHGKPYDPVASQLSLSVVAINTTSDLVTETMLRLIERPELVEDVRKEIVEVLNKEGWSKKALFNMKLLDSVTKEAQRLKPITAAIMNRKAKDRVTLPGGLVLEKGDRCMSDLGSMYDPNIYPDPETFDGYRFFRMRSDPEMESKAHLVSTSSIHMGFGHGRHACPGRFFASNEAKVLLAHLIYKYDWKLEDGYVHTIDAFGLGLSSGDCGRVFSKKRMHTKLDIDALL
ncbi:ent-kaurene oxidase [Fusarium tjaetaba]|uniref:Ent-kaurene oxidase n=1 Tax=Fusarium tjaetaba TaxID=1567544 RepID=A0A8H5V9Y0_9HYPO|nr:ent-kaurene oxidase [Fusarium tjaetaba]KAF5614628.1 ent-kaurene oxidase [Fusarium tjaetaba]